MHAPLHQLHAQPERFGYFQALRLLLLARPRQGSRPTRHTADLLRTLDAAVRLTVTPGGAFPAGEIQQLYTDEQAPDAPPRLQVNFMGLTGPSGVLPTHYTEWLAQRQRARDTGPAAFFDLFNHRLLLLFWAAWARHQPAIMQELSPGQGAMRHVYDLIGMGTPGLLPGPGKRDTDRRERPPLAALGYYSGLIAQRPCNSETLARLLGDLCGAPVTATPCLGTWQPIPPTLRTRLAGPVSRLGQDAVLGSRHWDRQSTVRLRIGPLAHPHFHALLPGQPRLRQLAAMARFLVGPALDLHIQLSLRADDVKPARLDGGQPATCVPDLRARLGWNTWLAGRRDPRPAHARAFHFHAHGEPTWR